MLLQMSLLQAEAVNGLDNRLQYIAKLLGQAFEFYVQWIFQQVVVDVPYKVNETLLLWARQRVIDGVEIRHQDSPKWPKQFGQKRSFTIRPVEEENRIKARQHPNISVPVQQVDRRFIDLYKRAAQNVFQQVFVQRTVFKRKRLSESAKMCLLNRNAEEVFQGSADTL